MGKKKKENKTDNKIVRSVNKNVRSSTRKLKPILRSIVGKKVDIDHYDTDKYLCKQLIVWDPVNNEIVGGYRFNIFYDLKNKQLKDIPLLNKSLYNVSDNFVSDYLPYLVELSRAFIQPRYQPKNAGRKAAFSLDNIWDGLGALVIKYPFAKYYFGRFIFFSNYNSTVRDSMFYFFDQMFLIFF